MAIIEARSVTGPARNLIDFCRQSREFGSHLEPVIITFHRVGSDWPSDFISAARRADLQVEVITERFRFDPRALSELKRIARQLRPDIIQTHGVKSHFLVRLSGLWGRSHWIAFHHGYTHTDLKMVAYNQLDRWSLRAAELVITVSRAFAAGLVRAGVAAERIIVLHNSVDAERFARLSTEAARHIRARINIRDDEVVLLSVGRLSREKGHEDLIRAFDRLRRSRPELKARLLIVGQGPELRRLERLVDSFGMARLVTFTGHVPDPEPYYAMADVFILPSRSEGSPNALLEAMAAAIPVIATRVGGVPEIVSDGSSALLVPPGDPEAMAKAIVRALEDDQLTSRLTSRAKELVLARHSIRARVAALTEIYGSLMGRGAFAVEAR
jgi:glycosyltransferase involved in cell wall biosynthesis